MSCTTPAVVLAARRADELSWSPGPWLTEVAPRLGVPGFAVASVTVDRMTTQVVSTSRGLLPAVTIAHRVGIYRATIAKQTVAFTSYLALTREIKLALDRVQPSPAFSVMVACGVAGVPCSSLQYNWTIQDTYAYHRTRAQVASESFLRANVAPGLVWCFLRAGCGTGGGLYFGPSVARRLERSLPAGWTLHDSTLSFVAGLLTGASGSLATQWVHNVTLVAGRMAALGATLQAPHYTAVALRQAWTEMGVSILYRNFGPRMVINAFMVGVLSLSNIFHRPELSGWS